MALCVKFWVEWWWPLQMEELMVMVDSKNQVLCPQKYIFLPVARFWIYSWDYVVVGHVHRWYINYCNIYAFVCIYSCNFSSVIIFHSWNVLVIIVVYNLVQCWIFGVIIILFIYDIYSCNFGTLSVDSIIVKCFPLNGIYMSVKKSRARFW